MNVLIALLLLKWCFSFDRKIQKKGKKRRTIKLYCGEKKANSMGRQARAILVVGSFEFNPLGVHAILLHFFVTISAAQTIP